MPDEQNETLEITEPESIGTCYNCGDDLYEDTITERLEGEIFCESCYANRSDCDHCNTTSLTSTVEFRREIDTYLCDYCFCNYMDSSDDSDNDRHPLIHDYGYRPSPNFHGSPDHGLYYGFELEIQVKNYKELYGGIDELIHCNDGAVERLICNNRLYLKEDSSIDPGVEIVSHPHSMYYYYGTDNDNPYLNAIVESAAGHFVATDKCGLHIHVSRELSAFRDRVRTYRMAHLLQNTVLFERLSGRENFGYCQTGMHHRNGIRHKTKGICNYRHDALNTTNKNTVEVRIWSSSLDLPILHARFEITKLLVEFSRTLRFSPENAPREINFLSYLLAHGSDTVKAYLRVCHGGKTLASIQDDYLTREINCTRKVV